MKGVVVSNRSENGNQKKNSSRRRRTIKPLQKERATTPLMKSVADPARAARTQVVEETTYRLTDLYTAITGRIEILSDRVPGPCREELLAIRAVVTKCVELNRRLFVVAQECRAEMGF
jgi:hypothetical protein